MGPRWFVRKPELREAWRYNGHISDLPTDLLPAATSSVEGGPVFLLTPAGTLRCEVGDWILRQTVRGQTELTTCSNRVFRDCYELAASPQ